jgi:hypothetical protein
MFFLLRRWVIKDEMQHATQCKGGEQSGMKCNMIMNEQNDMT